MTKILIIHRILPFFLIILLGCAQTSPNDPLVLTDPDKELLRICKEEHNFDITVTPFDHTVWVYLSLEENLFRMKADPKGFSNLPTSAIKPSIKFLDSEYRDGDFHLTYDIATAKGYAKSYGYTSDFSEEYKTKQRHLLTAIYRAFNETDDTPEFFVIIIADIVNGLESRTTIHFDDLKRAYMDQSFHEEYAKRVISEQPTGNVNLIGDTEGRNVNYSDITWPEFLSKQMVFRVNFKYQRSAFSPSDDTPMELLIIAADTVAAYDFKDFASIQLHDLANNTNSSTSKKDLTHYESESSEGRLIHIKFQ